jgi:hypothetical protein
VGAAAVGVVSDDRSRPGMLMRGFLAVGSVVGVCLALMAAVLTTEWTLFSLLATLFFCFFGTVLGADAGVAEAVLRTVVEGVSEVLVGGGLFSEEAGVLGGGWLGGCILVRGGGELAVVVGRWREGRRDEEIKN